jgi:hypothetical protein
MDAAVKNARSMTPYMAPLLALGACAPRPVAPTYTRPPIPVSAMTKTTNEFNRTNMVLYVVQPACSSLSDKAAELRDTDRAWGKDTISITLGNVEYTSHESYLTAKYGRPQSALNECERTGKRLLSSDTPYRRAYLDMCFSNAFRGPQMECMKAVGEHGKDQGLTDIVQVCDAVSPTDWAMKTACVSSMVTETAEYGKSKSEVATKTDVETVGEDVKSAGTQPKPEQRDAVERLRQLTEAFDARLIDAEMFETKKKAIIGEM